MNILSIRENPENLEKTIAYFQEKWASEASMMVYEDCITSCLKTENPLPQWYLLEENGEILGCAGLITNDFISRMDLYPWVCALYIEEKHRGKAFGGLLLERAKLAAKKGGFSKVYLCTDHIGYYEKFGFEYMGTGYHPWGDSSRIYEASV